MRRLRALSTCAAVCVSVAGPLVAAAQSDLDLIFNDFVLNQWGPLEGHQPGGEVLVTITLNRTELLPGDTVLGHVTLENRTAFHLAIPDARARVKVRRMVGDTEALKNWHEWIGDELVLGPVPLPPDTSATLPFQFQFPGKSPPGKYLIEATADTATGFFVAAIPHVPAATAATHIVTVPDVGQAWVLPRFVEGQTPGIANFSNTLRNVTSPGLRKEPVTVTPSTDSVQARLGTIEVVAKTLPASVFGTYNFALRKWNTEGQSLGGTMGGGYAQLFRDSTLNKTILACAPWNGAYGDGCNVFGSFPPYAQIDKPGTVSAWVQFKPNDPEVLGVTREWRFSASGEKYRFLWAGDGGQMPDGQRAFVAIAFNETHVFGDAPLQGATITGTLSPASSPTARVPSIWTWVLTRLARSEQPNIPTAPTTASKKIDGPTGALFMPVPNALLRHGVRMHVKVTGADGSVNDEKVVTYPASLLQRSGIAPPTPSQRPAVPRREGPSAFLSGGALGILVVLGAYAVWLLKRRQRI